MKAVTFYFWNLELTPSLHRLVLPFLPYMMDLIFSKTLNIGEDSKSITYIAIMAYRRNMKYPNF